MKATVLALGLALTPLLACAKQCNFPANESTAFDGAKISLPWRSDMPSTPGTRQFPWQTIDFTKDWRGYMAAFVTEIRASGIRVENRRLKMNPAAEWWIAPWMDYGVAGREPLNGLTAERGPDPKDLSPTSPGDLQTWAVGWYNQPGSYSIGQVFKNPCDPEVAADFAFPAQSASFKFLFSNATGTDVGYLRDAPEIDAMINPDRLSGDPPPSVARRIKRAMRLIQVDIAVKDPAARDTGWIMGTFVWMRPPASTTPASFKGDWVLDNLVFRHINNET